MEVSVFLPTRLGNVKELQNKNKLISHLFIFPMTRVRQAKRPPRYRRTVHLFALRHVCLSG